MTLASALRDLLNHRSTISSRRGKHPRVRRLRLQPLEDRALMAARDLDPTFSGDGMTTISIVETREYGDAAMAIAAQPDGKFLVGGTHIFNVGKKNGLQKFEFDFAVARLDANGALDPTFGNGGTVTTAISTAASPYIFEGQSHDEIYDLAVQPDGRIVAVGKTNLAMAVVRYNANGTLDTTFGQEVPVLDKRGRVIGTTHTGKVILDLILSTAADEARDVQIQSDGKIVVGGTSLVRLNSDGSMDTTFGNGGALVGLTMAGLELDSEERILFISGGGDFKVARYTANGTPDLTFGANGVASISTPHVGRGWELTIQADGKIVAAGVARLVNPSTSTTVEQVAVARFLDTGASDPDFGGGAGYVLGPIDPSWIARLANAVKVDQAGRIVVGGYQGSQLPINNGLMMRFDSAGNLDTSFGIDGVLLATTHVGSSDFVIQPDNRIVVASRTLFSAGFGNQMFVARYLGDAAPLAAASASNEQLLAVGLSPKKFRSRTELAFTGETDWLE